MTDILANTHSIAINITQCKSATDIPIPSYATQGSAGFDICANISSPITLSQMMRKLIPTGIAMALPVGFEAQVRPRSGLAAKHGITVLNTPGTIDSDYRGEIKVILINLSQEDFTVERGMRIAQIIIHPVIKAVLQPVSELATQTSRGEGGFGSTGL